jgi:hypothetical protein
MFIGLLLADSLLSDISSLVNQTLHEGTRIILFSIIVTIAVLLGIRIIILNIQKIKTEFLSNSNVLLLLSRVMPFIQYTIIGLLILITLQIIFTLQYATIFLVASLALSWSTGVMMMGIMSFKFIQWYRAKRSFLALLYLISSLMFCATLGATIIPQLFITIQSSSAYVNSHSTEVKPFQVNPQNLSIFFAIISIANWLVIPLVFILWAATASMLNHYSTSFGKIKYWIMLSAPLASFIIGTTSWLFFLPSLTSIFDEKVIPYTIMAFGGILAEGFLLSFAFVNISKTIQKKTRSKINDYLRISAIGIAILFVSFFANPSAASYLPFGVLSASFFAFGSYLFFVGIYASATLVARDSGLRKEFYNTAMSQSNLLKTIGVTEMEKELIKKYKSIDKHARSLEEHTVFKKDDVKDALHGLVDELDEEKAREILHDVLTELYAKVQVRGKS